MIFARVAPAILLIMFASSPHRTPTLTVSVSSAEASIGTPLRVIANAGTIVSDGRSYRLSADTLRLTSSAEVTTTDPVFAGTFIADAPRARLSVSVRENGNLVASGVGEVIIVIRTPMGAQLQAMGASALTRTP